MIMNKAKYDLLEIFYTMTECSNGFTIYIILDKPATNLKQPELTSYNPTVC